MSSKVDNRALDHKCPACRAPIEFKVKLGKWKCDYCDNEYTLDDLKKYNNASSEKVNLGAAGDDTQYDSYRCTTCGAEISYQVNLRLLKLFHLKKKKVML